jgi:hypothetical protein
MATFRIHGVVQDEETGAPLPGLEVKAYDKDLLFDDVLGSAISDPGGNFEIVSDVKDFKEFVETRPDIYLKVFRVKGDTREQIHTTEKAVRWRAGKLTRFRVQIPSRVIRPERARLVLLDESLTERTEFEVGESMVIAARGLRPVLAYDIEVSSDDVPLFTGRLITNVRGELEPTVLWPQLGLDDPNTDERLTVSEARARWAGRRLRIRAVDRNAAVAEQRARIQESAERPLLLTSDRAGRLLNGFEAGTQPLFVTLANLSFTGRARIALIRRQQEWRRGDRFEIATLANGEPAIREIDVRSGPREAVVELFPADQLLPGAYDFILRPLRYGWEEDDTRIVLDRDVIGSRLTTGLVVREAFMLGKPVLGGCVNKIQLSGRTVPGAPYFRFADTFQVGENVYAALDPGLVDPGNLGKMCALYVIPNRTQAQWNADSGLNHLPVLGGNPAVPKVKVQPGCVNANKVLVWPNAMQTGEYDIVADFGNNTSNAAAFVPDDSYDTPLDVIDGYFVAGFRVVRDPGVHSEYAHAGSFSYLESNVAALGLPGTVTVQDELTHYSTPGAFSSVNVTVPMRARVYFPADAAGSTMASQISVAQANYPVVVVVHGNGHAYTSYDFLLSHLARNGFIAASIHLNSGMSGLGRANVFFHHMQVLQTLFAAHIQNNVGLIGHSRGGEAVFKAARLNHENGLGHNIKALIPLAPTDQYGKETLGGAFSTPLLVVYGSRDGDITGGIWTPGYTVPQTGFALYDRAAGASKSMVFVYRATHNGFITNNVDAPWDSENIADMLPPADQRKVTLAYMNAFMRLHLRGESQWGGVMTGEWTPASVEATGMKLYVQHRDTARRTVDQFTNPPNWMSSSIGGTVSQTGLPVVPQEGALRTLDPKSPHDDIGLQLRWDSLGDRLEFAIPASQKNVNSFGTVSIRITQRVDSPHNPANQIQNLRVALRDTFGNERAVRVGAFAEVPFPDYRVNHAHTKSALCTIRIPLAAYTIVCAGMQQVDLTNVDRLALVFSEKPTGEISIDDVEFSN